MTEPRTRVLWVGDPPPELTSVQSSWVARGGTWHVLQRLADAEALLREQGSAVCAWLHDAWSSTEQRGLLDLLREQGGGAIVVEPGREAGTMQAAGAWVANLTTSPEDWLGIIERAEAAWDATLAGRARRAVERAAAFVTHGPRGRDLLEVVERVAASPAPLLVLEGDEGVGKKALARRFHAARLAVGADAPRGRFEARSLAGDAVEVARALFGGAGMVGLLESVGDGTLYLDGVTSFPHEAQDRLASALVDRVCISADGGRRSALRARVVLGFRENVAEARAAGVLSPALADLLSGVTVRIPALRDRLEDLPALVEHFRKEAVRGGAGAPGVRHEVIELLSRQPWAGHVGELRRVVEQAVAEAGHTEVTVDHLPERYRARFGETTSRGKPRQYTLPSDGLVIDDVVADFLDQALLSVSGNKSQAAKLLGIHRDQVRYWVKKYGLEQWVRTRKQKGQGPESDRNAPNEGEHEA